MHEASDARHPDSPISLGGFATRCKTLRAGRQEFATTVGCVTHPALAKLRPAGYLLRMRRNITLYPWFKFAQQLIFFQAVWFLYFEGRLSASEAILLYVVADICTTVLEVPSGYMSDRLGRRPTLLAAALCGVAATVLLVVAEGFAQFALANILLGAAAAFASGTDSSLLFESLKAEGRSAEIEVATLKAWRFSFIALALSALTGGAMALYDEVLPFAATAISAAALLAITALLHEPPHAKPPNHRENLRAIGTSLTEPTLLWLLCLSLVMYVFSHIPFVFGQPFLREALTAAGYAAQTPLVSGGVTFSMMVISLAVSLVAVPLRKTLGLPGILLLAFGMQVGLAAALALSNSLFVVALLLLRMVPDSLSQPFILARVQPLLPDGIRATYLSVQSLAGRLLFAGTLSLAATQTTDKTAMPYADMQVILAIYATCGLLALITLALTARRARV
jgi:MFS family permease